MPRRRLAIPAVITFEINQSFLALRSGCNQTHISVRRLKHTYKDMLLRIHSYRPFLVRILSHHSRPLSSTSLLHSRQPTSSSASPPPNNNFNRPSPPRLPRHLQEEFEALQRQAETAPTGITAEDGRELHPDTRPGVKAEFVGERNPVTGEVGGPKVEPTRHGDWSYGGRASDF